MMTTSWSGNRVHDATSSARSEGASVTHRRSSVTTTTSTPIPGKPTPPLRAGGRRLSRSSGPSRTAMGTEPSTTATRSRGLTAPAAGLEDPCHTRPTHSSGKGGCASGLTARRSSANGLSSPAVRFRLISSQPAGRWTSTHSPSPRTQLPIGSINERQSESRSPAVSSSRCRLHRRFGPWLRYEVPGAPSPTSSRHRPHRNEVVRRRRSGLRCRGTSEDLRRGTIGRPVVPPQGVALPCAERGGPAEEEVGVDG